MHALINKTTHSHGRSVMTVPQLVSALSKGGVEVAALTDLHTLTGIPQFLLLCEKHGIHGIAGLTLNICNGDVFCGELTLLANGNEGYSNLQSLIDHGKHISVFNKEFSTSMGLQLKDLLGGKFTPLFANIIALDGYPGSIGEYLAKEIESPSLSTVTASYLTQGSDLHRLRKQFPEGCYLGTQLCGRKSAIAHALSDERLRGSSTYGAVQTTIAHGVSEDDLTASKQLFTMMADGWLSQFPEGTKFSYVDKLYHGKLLDVDKNFDIEPGFASAAFIKHKLKTADRAYKSTPITDLIVGGGGETSSLSESMNSRWEQFRDSLAPEDVMIYKSQIRHELGIIKKLGFENYFLNIYKIKNLCESSPGNSVMLRGSAVGSLVMHVLGLSAVDPIKNGLLFARFLSEHRVEEPDVDMEFVDPVLLKKSLQKFFDNGGGDLNPQFAYLSDSTGIANAFQLLSHAKDAITHYVKMTPQQQKSLSNAFDILTKFAYERNSRQLHKYGQKKKWEDIAPQLKSTVDKMPNFPEINRLYQVASAIFEGSLGSKVSAASLVVIPEGVREHFNLIHDKGVGIDLPRIPMTKTSLPSTGFIKYDLLPNHSFKRTINGLKLAGIPGGLVVKNNDSSIGYLFRKKAFLGVCQLNAYAGERLAQQMLPTTYEDLTALFALIRDASGKESDALIQSYLSNKANPEGLKLPFGLKPILSETHGALLYEEQLMKILIDVGGFEWTEADAFRSAIKKGKYEVIAKNESRFISAVQERFGLSASDASIWYQPIRDKNGRFVFSKAHAVAYAHLAVQQCYLKCKYPAVYSAELYLDSSFLFKEKKVQLQDVLQNWSMQLMKDGTEASPEFTKSPQSIYDFVDAVASIVVREVSNPETTYRIKDLNVIRHDLSTMVEYLSKMGLYSGNLPVDQLRRDLLLRFEQKVAPVSNIARVRSDNTNAAPQKSSQSSSGTNLKKSGNADVSDGGLDAASIKASLNKDAQPINKQDGIDLSKDVMLGHFLWFLSHLKCISPVRVDTSKSKSHDHFRFTAKSKSGEMLSYHISATSLDPKRACEASSKHAPQSGCFQGGSRNNVGINSAEHLMIFLCHDGVLPGFPEIKSLPGKGQRDTLDAILDEIRPSIMNLVRNADVPLYGMNSLVAEFTSAGVDAPLLPIFYDKNLMSDDKKSQLVQNLIVNGRGMNEGFVKKAFDSGLLQYGTMFGKPYESSKKPGSFYRSEKDYIVAQFRALDGKTPLWDLPMPKGLQFASGGHQWMYSKDGKTQRPDHATNKVVGHFWGDPIPGSKILWMCEGLFDAMAFNELQRILPSMQGDLSWVEPNAISVKSTGGAIPFIEKLLNIKLTFTEVNNKIVADFVETSGEVERLPITEDRLRTITDWFKDRTIHWYEDPSTPYEGIMLRSLLKRLDLTSEQMKACFRVHHRGRNTTDEGLKKVLKFDVVNPKDCLLHAGNLSHWAKLNNIDFSSEVNASGEYEIFITQEKKLANAVRFSRMPSEQQMQLSKKLQEKFKQLSGSLGLGCALDGDQSGLAEEAKLRAFASAVKLPYATFIPKAKTMPHPLELNPSREGADIIPLKDHNDILRAIKRFQKENLLEPLFRLIKEYNQACRLPGDAFSIPPQKPALQKPTPQPRDNECKVKI